MRRQKSLALPLISVFLVALSLAGASPANADDGERRSKLDKESRQRLASGAEVDFVIPLPSPRPEQEQRSVAVDPPGPTTPPENAYMPTRDIGAPQFVAANPSFDGRGVTIGILDTGVDLDHPALQATTTGRRKVVDWVTFTDPTDDRDPTWLHPQAVVTVGLEGTFAVGERPIRARPKGRGGSPR